MKHYGQQENLYCLNRGWKFIEKDFSVLPPTKNHDDVYGFAKGGACKGPADTSFDDSDWEVVELPHDWVTKKQFVETGSPNQGYKERGIGWYRLRFGLEEEDRKKQILLEFEGMSANAEIYVNGMILKRSYSGYNSFCVDMTDMANFGVVPNTIAIRIDASAWEGWWYEGAGIYRNVWLVKKSAAHIGYQGVYIKPTKINEEQWQLQLETEIENSFEFSKEVIVSHTIVSPKGEVVGTVKGEATVINGFERKKVMAEYQIENPDIWDIESPSLYEVKTELYYEGERKDYQKNSTGFRTIELLADSGFWLNGRNIKLKGFCNHQDHAGVGVAVSYNLQQFRIKKLKELGTNAYRCAHNPDPAILDICDREGLLVMEENRTFSSAKDVLEEVKGIVKNARNHPCVILYSVFNEEPLQGTRKGHQMAGRLKEAVKEMDDQRPVLGAFNGGYMEEEGAATILDAVGINYNPKRYDDFHKKYPNIPLMGSETASAFMVRGEYKTDYSKNIIDDYDSECALWGTKVKDTWRYVNERPYVAGSFVWTGFDYRGEPTPFEWPSVGTFFGTYDSCGFEKDACYLYKAFWGKEKMVHLVSPWAEEKMIGSDIKVMVTTNCEYVKLYVNGELVKEGKPDEYEQITFEIPCEKGVLKAEGFMHGEVVAIDEQKTALKEKKIVIEPVEDSIQTGGHDIAILNVKVVDEQGVVVPNAENKIQLEVENGIVVGTGNGDPNSHEPDVASYRKTFHGRCQFLVKPEQGMEKDMKIRAFSEGLEEEEVTITLEKVEEIPYIVPIKEKIVEGWRLYYELFDEMPDAKMKTDRNDMNSFEPVNFTGQPQPELSGKLEQYAMYRTQYDFGQAKEERNLYFTDVKGYVWIYFDGEEVFCRTDSFGGSIILPLEETFVGKHEVTVVVYNGNKEYPEAGICNQVLLTTK